MSERVVEIENLSRRFGKTVALDEVDFSVSPGCVYGLVGANGAGKTTLIKHILGLLRAKTGSVRVFGLDPVKNPVEVLRRIGYLSEERDLPEWMRIHELMRYTRAYHPNWDTAYADELIKTFGLDPSTKVKSLSKGMRAQTGLIAAAAHRPDLLLLDEPSTGLDAVVRRDILNAIVRAVADDGRTVLFSSHLLDEVELMSDYVTMIHDGRAVLQGELDGIKERHHILNVQFSAPLSHAPELAGALSVEGQGRSWTAVCDGAFEQVRDAVSAMGGEIVNTRNASLQEIFVARVGRRHLPVEED
jgi:ABC-type multidrug transport system ATPase subunit